MSTTERSGGRDGSDLPAGARDRLDELRSNPRERAFLLALAAVVGLTLAWVHWLGIVAGGALVALASSTPGRGTLAAVGFGVVVLVAFAAVLGGSAWAVAGMTPIVYVTAGGAIGLAALGSLVRWVV